jgi:hypothetical protein
LAQSRTLVHESDYERGEAEQRKKWDATMKYGGSNGISASTWKQAKQLLKQLGRKYKEPNRGAYRPDWSRLQTYAKMEVDHIVELQLVTSGDRGWADSIINFELLERAANRSSGSLLKDAIVKERKRLFEETGDRVYLDQPLVFERVVLGNEGIIGERWTPEEIRAGEHLDALRANVVTDALGELAAGALNYW